MITVKKALKDPFITSSVLIFSSALLLIYTWFCINYIQQYEERDRRVQRLEEKSRRHHLFKNQFDEFHTQLSAADPKFIQKNVETLSFLELEKKRVDQLSLTQPHIDLHKAKEYLKSNQLNFDESQVRQKGPYKESLLVQKQTVLVNEEDVKKLLCLIEGTTIFPYAPVSGKPQLIIKSFELQKKSFAPYQNVYGLDLKIFKREKGSNDKKTSSAR